MLRMTRIKLPTAPMIVQDFVVIFALFDPIENDDAIGKRNLLNVALLDFVSVHEPGERSR